MVKPFTTVAAMVMSLMLLGCQSDQKKEQTVDTKTAASQKAKSWLPEKGDTYTVLGYTPGIKGALIKYDENLYRGGNILSIEGGKYLQSLGVKTVISVTPDETINTICNSLDITTVELYYDYGKLTDSITDEFLSILENEESPYYIHCFSGKQRAGQLSAIYRLHKDKWSFEDAEKEYGLLGGKVQEDHELLQRAERVIQKRL